MRYGTVNDHPDTPKAADHEGQREFTRKSEAKSQALFDNMAEGFALFEVVRAPDGQIIDLIYREANKALEHQTGFDRAKILGQPLTAILTPTDAACWIPIFARAIDPGEPVSVEEYAETVGRWYEVSAYAHGQDEIAVFYRDISERKRAEAVLRENEERQAFLLQLSDALRAEPSAGAVGDRALQMLFEHMRLDRCYIGIYRLAEDRGEFPHQVHDDRLPPVPAEIRLSDFPKSLQIAFDRTLVVDNVAEKEGFSDNDRANIEALGLRALVAATLRKGENIPLWAIVVGSTHPRAWTQSEVSLVEEVAERTWAAVERARAEVDLAEQLAAARQLQELSIELIRADKPSALHDRLLDAMKAIMHSDAASLQSFDAETKTLRLICSTGFQPATAKAWASVSPASGTACGQALSGVRSIIPDVEQSEQMSGTSALEEFRRSGLHAVQSTPLIARDGRLLGMISTHWKEPHQPSEDRLRVFDVLARQAADLVDRGNAEAALRESEARYRALVTVGSSTIYRMSPDWQEMRALDGAGFVTDSDEPTTDWIETYLPADERPRVAEAIERAIRAKDVFELEHRVFRMDGTIGWTLSRAIPLLDEAGEIMEWFGVASDVTERVKADQSFTRLFEASPAPFLVLAPDPPRFTITEVNDAYLAATLRTREELIGRALFDAFPDNPNEPTIRGVSNLRASLEKVLGSRRPDELPGLKYDIARPDGTFEERWWSPVNSPILNDNGEVEAIIHNANDVTKERRSEQHQALLLAELQHRVRNILTIVRSVARRTADNCEDVDDYVGHLDGRLSALARVQTLLAREPGQGVNLHNLVLDELETQADWPTQYRIEGPAVELPAKAAEVFSLAVHELATNSIKYGALSKSRGTIQIRWDVKDRDGRSWLRFTWTEPVGGEIARPARIGFGTDLLRHRVPYELRGTGDIRFGRGEVEAVIDFPLSDEKSILESSHSKGDIGQ